MIPLPLAFGAPLLSARIRTTPEDFQVDELPAFEATGEGEHLLLHIRKRGANTVHVAKLLAAWAGLPEMAVSYAGMKDRHAVTTQRFSVHLPKRVAPDLASLARLARSGATRLGRCTLKRWVVTALRSFMPA